MFLLLIQGCPSLWKRVNHQTWWPFWITPEFSLSDKSKPFFLSLAILCHIMCENAFVFTLRQSCEFHCWFVIVWFSSNVYVIMFTEDSGMWWFTASFQVLKMLWTIFNPALLVSNICLVFYFVNNFMLTKHSSIFSDTTRLDAFNGLMNFVVLVWIHLK